MLDKFTGIRLSPDMKDRINKVKFLFKKEQTFSDVLRDMALRGLISTENETFLISQNLHLDLRIIAQKYENGEMLDLNEICYVLNLVYLSFTNNSLFSFTTIKSINEAFLSVATSKSCILDSGYIIENLQNYDLIDSSKISSLPTTYSTDDILNMVLGTCENFKKLEDNWNNYRNLSKIEGMAKILDYLSNTKNDHILDQDKFYQVLAPFLQSFINVAKRYSSDQDNCKFLPMHYYNLHLFIEQYNFDDMRMFSKDNFLIACFFNSKGEAVFYINFSIHDKEDKDTFAIGSHYSIYEMNDLINIAKYYNTLIDSMEKNISLSGRCVSVRTAYESDTDMFTVFLSHKGVQITFGQKMWKEFTIFLIGYEKNFNQQFTQIRQQYGDY